MELAELTTQSSLNGGDMEEAHHRLATIKSNSSISLSLDGELKPSKVVRKTLRSTSTSVDLDLPELHETQTNRPSRRALKSRSLTQELPEHLAGSSRPF